MCTNPQSRRDKVLNRSTQYPCGKCKKCIKKYISDWSIRLYEQMKVSENAYFVTFTYNEDSVNRTNDGLLTLSKHDFQLYMKKLRYDNKKHDIKYFCCGEYGTKTARPHLHALIFNVDVNTIGTNWQHGFIDIKPMSLEAVPYVLKYAVKNRQSGNKREEYKANGLEPPFLMMSKGIGKNYINKMSKYHKSSFENTFYMQNGYKKSLPRYYKENIFKDDLEALRKFIKEKIENLEKVRILASKDENLYDYRKLHS